MNKYSASVVGNHSDFLSLGQLRQQEFSALLALSKDMRSKSMFAGALQGKSVAMIFQKPSLRTRTTFEIAVRELGGQVIALQSDVALGRRERVDLISFDTSDERLDVTVSSRATQESVNMVQQSVNLANSKLDQLLANLAAFQAQNLRLQIEANMANGTDDAAIGQFALPAAQSGFLELARSILVETIQKLQATGQGIRNAPTYLAQGDQQKAAGRFKEAYDSYSQAYRAATGH